MEEEEEIERRGLIRGGWLLRDGGGGQRGMVSVTRPVILQWEGGEDPISTGVILLQRSYTQQTGLMLVNVSFVLDVALFSPCTFRDRCSRGRGGGGGRLNERPEMAALLSEEQVIGPSMVERQQRETLIHTHTHARARSSLI